MLAAIYKDVKRIELENISIVTINNNKILVEVKFFDIFVRCIIRV